MNNTKNAIFIEPRTEQIFNFKSNFLDTEAIVLAQGKGNVRLPNASVKINYKGEFISSVIIVSAMSKTINLADMKIEPIQNYSINNFKGTEISDE